MKTLFRYTWLPLALSSILFAQFGGPMGGPPEEAFSACEGKNSGDSCSHPTPHGDTVSGSCTQRGDRLQCIPSHHRQGGGGPNNQNGGMMGGSGSQSGFGQGNRFGGSPQLDSNGNSSERNPSYTFENTPVRIERSTPVAFTLPGGQTHWYEVVYTPDGGVNWIQAKQLSESTGGYLVTLHSKEENEFVFNLIKDEKYWFKWDSSHNYVMNGPFLGGFQPSGSNEPDGGWKWVSGEPWSYTNWAYDGMPGDKDPRPNDQPNDSTGNQDITAFGEVNFPVATWGDFPHKFSSYHSEHEGKSYGFVIEYESQPKK